MGRTARHNFTIRLDHNVDRTIHVFDAARIDYADVLQVYPLSRIMRGARLLQIAS